MRISYNMYCAKTFPEESCEEASEPRVLAGVDHTGGLSYISN